MDVILRNIERLVYSDASEREPIEPMTEWKWNKLYQIVRKYGIGPWIAEGIKVYENDFFLQLSPTLRQQLLDLAGEKDAECLAKYESQIRRSQGIIQKFSPQSLHAYASDLVKNIKNIEE